MTLPGSFVPLPGCQFAKAMSRTFALRGGSSATPHNGHSNSFSALLEILDPQRFTRGVPVRPRELDAVMVRRLKSDLRHFGERFPKRNVVPITIDGLPADAPDLRLVRMLAEYGAGLRRRAETLPPRAAGLARLAFVGLQQRLLSSPQAFAETLKIHIASLDRPHASAAVASAFAHGAAEATEDEPDEEARGMAAIEREEQAQAEAAAAFAGPAADRAAAQAMLEVATEAARRPDARVKWLARWIRETMAPGGIWNTRRLVIFTEYAPRAVQAVPRLLLQGG